MWRGRPRSRLGKDSEVRASPELIHSLPDYVSGSLSIAEMVKNLQHSSSRKKANARRKLGKSLDFVNYGNAIVLQAEHPAPMWPHDRRIELATTMVFGAI